jgi:hypothetical protein
MPSTTSWNERTIAYDVQNALRRSRNVRSTTRSSNIAAATPTTTLAV